MLPLGHTMLIRSSATFSRSGSLDAFVDEVHHYLGHGGCYIFVRSSCAGRWFPVRIVSAVRDLSLGFLIWAVSSSSTRVRSLSMGVHITLFDAASTLQYSVGSKRDTQL